jgi:outer membrane lipoprotein SlyB
MDNLSHLAILTRSPGAVVKPSLAERFRHSKALIPTMAVMSVTVMALAAALVMGKTQAQSGMVSPIAAQSLQAAPHKAAPELIAAPQSFQAPQKEIDTGRNLQRAPLVAQAAPRSTAPRAAACKSCGTVESVVAVQRKGKVNGVNVGNATVGLGTVAGGVLGGVLGNQVGGGNGRTAMTVIGAAGGAYAGNRVEENMKKVIMHQMRVRMSDGSVRTIEQSSAVAVGSRVVVEGNSMRPAGG